MKKAVRKIRKKKSGGAVSVHRAVGFNTKRYNLHEIFNFPKILYLFFKFFKILIPILINFMKNLLEIAAKLSKISINYLL